MARKELTFERYSEAGHVVMLPAQSEQPAFENWINQRYGVSRRIEVTTYSFTASAFLIIGTERIATMHARLARRLQPALPITLLPVPLTMPPMEQAMQWHKYRTLDPGLAWLRQLMVDATRLMAAADVPGQPTGQP
jgi:LysR family nod box-dependent transcriptional activator